MELAFDLSVQMFLEYLDAYLSKFISRVDQAKGK
jgi:hypothetical protein